MVCAGPDLPETPFCAQQNDPPPLELEKVRRSPSDRPTSRTKTEQLDGVSSPPAKKPKVGRTSQKPPRAGAQKLPVEASKKTQSGTTGLPMPPSVPKKEEKRSPMASSAQPALCVTCGEQPSYGQAEECFACLIVTLKTKARRAAEATRRCLERRKQTANQVEKISLAPEDRTNTEVAGGGIEPPKLRPRRLPTWWWDATPAVQESWLRGN